MRYNIYVEKEHIILTRRRGEKSEAAAGKLCTERKGKRGPEQERDPGRNTGPFTSDGEYDSLEAWADEEER